MAANNITYTVNFKGFKNLYKNGYYKYANKKKVAAKQEEKMNQVVDRRIVRGDRRFNGHRPQKAFAGLEKLGPFYVYRYDAVYDVYVVPSTIKDISAPLKGSTYIWNNSKDVKQAKLYCNKDRNYLCVGRLLENMNEEERKAFVNNYDEIADALGIELVN